MELSDFVSTTLLQVQEGVEKAIKERPSGPGMIVPFLSNGNHFGPADVIKVEFDVAVTVVEKSERGGKAGLKVLGFIEAGGEAKIAFEGSAVSRIKFSLPMIPPGQRVELKKNYTDRSEESWKTV